MDAALAWVSYLQRVQTQPDDALPNQGELSALLVSGQAEHLVLHMVQRMQASLETEHVPRFWSQLAQCQAACRAAEVDEATQEESLLETLQGLVHVVDAHCELLVRLAQQMLQLGGGGGTAASKQATRPSTGSPHMLPLHLAWLPQQYRMSVNALLMADSTRVSISGLLQHYFGAKLRQLSDALAERSATPMDEREDEEDDDDDDDEVGNRYTAFEPMATGSSPNIASHTTPHVMAAGGDAAAAAAISASCSPRFLSGIMVEGASVPSTPSRRTSRASPGGHQLFPPGTTGGTEALETPPLRRRTASVVSGQLGEAWALRLQRVCRCCHALALDAAAEEAHTAVIKRHVAQYLAATAGGVFDRPVLPQALHHMTRVPLEFLKLLLMTTTPAWESAGGQGGGEATAAKLEGRGAADGGLLQRQQEQQQRQQQHAPAAVGAHGQEAADAAAALHEWRLRLTYLLYETLGVLRIGEMFDLVIEHPDSAPALMDLAECLRHTNLSDHFVHSFRAALGARLLHAGVAANTIIHQYVSTIRALQLMDPTGTLLSAIAQPIRAYLRQRPDTIRCLVTMVTCAGGDGTADGTGSGGAGAKSLLEELQASSSARTAHAMQDEADSDEAAYRAVAGAAPAATGEAAPSTSGCEGASGDAPDIVGMLIGVYGSCDVFVDEFRSMLGGRLLYMREYEIDDEIRTLELLKLRFGEAALHSCEVMLKDMADSKRCNTNIQALPTTTPRVAVATAAAAAGAAAAARRNVALVGDSAGAEVVTLQQLSATIMSYLYWPQGDADKAAKKHQQAALVLPADVTAAMSAYAERYQRLKSPRCLEWRTALGVVELDMEVDGVEFSARVSPPLAVLMLQFQRHERRSVDQLAAAVGMPAAQVRRNIMFWVNAGVLFEERGSTASGTHRGAETVYRRATSLDSSMQGAILTDFTSDDSTGGPGSAGGGAVLSGSERLWEEMCMYENYVVGMLTNFKALPLDRLHKMLQLFVVSPRFDKTPEQLAGFLALLQGQEKVVCENGMYRMRGTAAGTTPATSENTLR